MIQCGIARTVRRVDLGITRHEFLHDVQPSVARGAMKRLAFVDTSVGIDHVNQPGLRIQVSDYFVLVAGSNGFEETRHIHVSVPTMFFRHCSRPRVLDRLHVSQTRLMYEWHGYNATDFGSSRHAVPVGGLLTRTGPTPTLTCHIPGQVYRWITGI